MDKTRIEMLDEMFRLQLEEDKKVHEAFGISYQDILNDKRYYFALLDEFGELNHELKPDWCWWKKSVGEVDREKVLEEFSDVTHFILSYCLAKNKGDHSLIIEALGEWDFAEKRFPAFEDYLVRVLVSAFITDILGYVQNSNPDSDLRKSQLKSDVDLIRCWFKLSYFLGLDFVKDVYETYVKKNAVNQQRVEEGY